MKKFLARFIIFIFIVLAIVFVVEAILHAKVLMPLLIVAGVWFCGFVVIYSVLWALTILSKE